MTVSFTDLDVRPILRAGGEPFAEIMKAVSSLAPGQGLRLFATFKPVPLFAVLAKKGFTHEETELEGGEWEVRFIPGAASPAEPATPAPAAGKPAVAEGDWPAPVQEMDNRELDPPEPMVRILAATEQMARGEVLTALLCREPAFLIPELESRGHAWKGAFEDDGTTYRIHIRIGG